MTIERTWVRVFLGTSGRILATVAGLFVLIVVAPVVLAIVGLWLLGLLFCVVGLACVGAIALGMLPPRRR